MTKQVQEDRSQFVIKANAIVRRSRFSMSAMQQKAYLFLISKIKHDDDADQPYTFSVGDFIRACGLADSGENYEAVKDALKSIRDISFWLDNGHTKTLLGLLDKVTIDTSSGTIECSFHEDIKPYLIHLRDNYTQYELQHVLVMRSKYAIRLYEISKSYQYTREFETSVEDLKKMMDAEVYTEYKAFKRRSLIPAVDEINLTSDINLSFVESKAGQTGRKVSHIKFLITPKNYDENWLAEKERERIYGKNTETDRG